MIVTIQLDTKLDRDADLLNDICDLMQASSLIVEDSSAKEKRPRGRPRKVVEPTPVDPALPVIVEKSAEGEPEVMHVTVYAPEVGVQEPMIDEPVITGPALDANSFRALAMAYNKTNGVKALLEVLERHGFGNIGAVTPDKYDTMAADLTL